MISKIFARENFEIAKLRCNAKLNPKHSPWCLSLSTRCYYLFPESRHLLRRYPNILSSVLLCTRKDRGASIQVQSGSKELQSGFVSTKVLQRSSEHVLRHLVIPPRCSQLELYSFLPCPRRAPRSFKISI